MKKLLAISLVLLLAVAMLASCNIGTGGNEDTTAAPEVVYDVAGAAEYVKALYKEELAITAVDYSVVSQVIVAGVTYTVEWTVDTDKVTVGTPADGLVKIDVNEKSPEELQYKLTATVKAADGTTEVVNFKLSVPKYSVNSHEDYMNAKQDDQLTVEGIVVAINSKAKGNKYNHLFLADTSVTGGYYCYSVTDDPSDLGIEVGMTVKVTGPMAPYSGMQEIKGGQVAIVDSTIKTVEPVDITDKFAEGANLGVYVGLPVVIKGVTIGTQDLEKDTSQYLYFSIGDKQGYVRTYVTDFPTTLNADKKAAIDADHAAHFGYKADASGILILYNGAPYLIPMTETPFTNFEEVVVTEAERVDAELGELKIDSSVSSDKVIDLPSVGKYYDNVTLTWATDDTTGAATIADGKLTLVVPDAEVVVNVTVTATCGDVTETKTYTVKLSKTITTIADAIAIGGAKDHNTYTDEKYIIAGIVKEVYNTTYGNMYIVDELGNVFTVYGSYSADGADRYDVMANAPVAGDYVVLVGALGQYNGTAQMKNAWIQSSTTPITIPEANELGGTFEKNQYTEDKKIITGVITEVQNTTYGNVVISDGNGNSILIYGLYNANGTVRYDGMATKPAVGDTITVLGIIGKYNDPQMKNGWLIGHSTEAGAPAETQPKDEEENVETPATPADGKYVFENYAAGEQYAANEVHKLDDKVTVTTTDAHFTKQIRLYKSEANEWGPARSGVAVFATTSAIKTLSVNAGEKTGSIEVYGSTDGENWTLLTTLAPITEYADYSIDLGGAAYTFIKLAAVDAQARVASVTITFN